MDEFVEFRLPFYQQRRESLLNQLQKRRVMLQNKSRFVQSVIDGSLTLRNKPIKVVMDEMEKMGIVGPHEGSKPRQVLITWQQYLEMAQSRGWEH